MMAAAAAARFSRNLIRQSISSSSSSATPPPRFLISCRAQSSQSNSNGNNEKLIFDDPELDSPPTSIVDPNLLELDQMVVFRRIESAMHQIVLRRLTPGWLPLVPGGSYWVPPPTSKTHRVAEMVGKLASSLDKDQQKAAKTAASVRSERGWPSKDYFVKGGFPIEMEMNSSNKSQSEDEE